MKHPHAHGAGMKASRLATALVLATASVSVAQNFPFPRSGDARFAYAKSEKPDGGQDELNRAVLYYYESWRGKFLTTITHADAPDKIDEGKEQAFVNMHAVNPQEEKMVPPFRSVSEGHGYGMLIAVLMAGYPRPLKVPADREKKDFDALYRFFRVHPSVPDSDKPTETHPDLMAFAVEGDKPADLARKPSDKRARGSARNTSPDDHSDSASDGDMDIAYALLLAARQWGNAGEINYEEEARKVIDACEQFDVNRAASTVKLGDALDEDDEKFFAIRTSDFMPQHWRAFAEAGERPPKERVTRRELWGNIIKKSLAIERAAFEKLTGTTGLMPDFLVLQKGARPEPGAYAPPTGCFLERKYGDGNWSYNACRTPWRLTTDYLVTGEASALDQLQKLDQTMQAIATRDGKLHPEKLNAGYTLDASKELPEEEDCKGKAKPRKREPNRDPLELASSCFLAPLAVSAMLPGNREWLNALWANLTKKNKAEEAYFDCTVKLLCMITISGNWWDPERAKRPKP